MQANKLIFLILIGISAAESRHFDDYSRLSLGKEADRSSEEVLKKFKGSTEFKFVEHLIQEHKLEKSENRRDYIRYYARDPPKNENLSDESSSSDSSENIQNNLQVNKHKQDNTKSTSSSENSSENVESDESNENSGEESKEVELDSQEKDDSTFQHRDSSKKGRESKRNQSKNDNHHRHSKSKHDSIETVKNISEDEDSESDESENKSTSINSSENLNVVDSSASDSSKSSEDITNEESIEKSDESIENKDIKSSEKDSNSIERDKIRSTEEIDSQDDNLSDTVNPREFKNKQSRESSRNYELGSAYRDVEKPSIQREKINIQNLLSELNGILESKRSMNTKTIHDNEIHKILKESIINKWREMDVAVKLILIDNYRSIKNTLLTEVNINPQATNRDIARLERKLQLLFNVSKKDIFKTVQLTKNKFRIETSKLNLSQQKVYEMEQLYISKLRVQIDAKITALKENVAFDIEQFHQEVKPIGDYTTQNIITDPTNTEIPFDPVFEITSTPASVVTVPPNINATGFGHVDIDNFTTGTLIEVDATVNSTTTEAGMGSHKNTGNERNEKTSRQYERSSRFLNDATTNEIKYPSNTAETTTNPIIREDPSIESLSSQTPPNSKTTPFDTNIKHNNTSTNDKSEQKSSETAIETTPFVTEISTGSTISHSSIIGSTGLVITSSTSDGRPTQNTSDPNINENPSSGSWSTAQSLPTSEVTPGTNALTQNDETINNQSKQKISETIVETTPAVFEPSTNSSTTSYPSMIGSTEQASSVTTKSTDDQKPIENTTDPIVSNDPSTGTLPTTQASPNSEETSSIISSTRQNIEHNSEKVINASDQWPANDSTTSENPSSDKISTTESSPNSEVTPVTSAITQNDETIRNEPGHKISEYIVETTSPVIETSTNSSTTSYPPITIGSTEQVNSVTTNNIYDQMTTENTSDPTVSKNPSTGTLSTTQTLPNSEITSSITSTTKQSIEQNNDTVSNQHETTSDQWPAETTTGSSISENPSSSTLPATQMSNSEETSITSTTKQDNITTVSQPDQKVSKITTEITSTITESSTMNNLSDQNTVKTGNGSTGNENLSTDASSTTPITSNSEVIPSTNVPTTSTTISTELSTESTTSEKNKLDNTSQHSGIILTTNSVISSESQPTTTDINECVDDRGLLIDCESIINSSTSAANSDPSTNQISQTWPGVPQECLPLFLSPNGEVLSSVSTENHTITDPQTLDLCLIIAKTIVQLNHPNNNKSISA